MNFSANTHNRIFFFFFGKIWKIGLHWVNGYQTCRVWNLRTSVESQKNFGTRNPPYAVLWMSLHVISLEFTVNRVPTMIAVTPTFPAILHRWNNWRFLIGYNSSITATTIKILIDPASNLASWSFPVLSACAAGLLITPSPAIWGLQNTFPPLLWRRREGGEVFCRHPRTGSVLVAVKR